MGEVAIVVHGGAGRMPRSSERLRAGAAAGVEAGHGVLAAGGSALDAVEAAVVALEEDPEFNAGRGAALTEDGGVELDAAVMEGTRRAAGAVACLQGVRNPIRAARAVLQDGRHVLLVGEAARSFAAAAGVEMCDDDWLATAAQREALAAGATGWAEGTVGAVARDAAGRLAAATSTGGTMGQRRGRVGDSPLIGAGTWADDDGVAVSCTGDGEGIIRVALAHEVDALVRLGGRSLDEACAEAIALLARHGGGGDAQQAGTGGDGRRGDGRGAHGGLIAVSAAGEVAVRFNSPSMTRAWRVGDGPVHAEVGGG